MLMLHQFGRRKRLVFIREAKGREGTGKVLAADPHSCRYYRAAARVGTEVENRAAKPRDQGPSLPTGSWVDGRANGGG